MHGEKVSIYAIFAGLIAFILLSFNFKDKNYMKSICAALVCLTIVWIIFDYVSMKRIKKYHKLYAKKNLARRFHEGMKNTFYDMGEVYMDKDGGLGLDDNLDADYLEEEKEAVATNDLELSKDIDSILENINRANTSPNEIDSVKTEDGDLVQKPLNVYTSESNKKINRGDVPLYENYQDLAKLNYYNAEGLKCSYSPELIRYNTSDLIGPTKAETFEQAYELVGCNGDTRIANRMKFQGLKDKMAKDIRVRQDRRSAQKYFGDELNIEERRVWWENPDIYDSVM